MATVTLTGFTVKDGDNWRLHKFTSADGKTLSTFDEELAEQLKGMLSQPLDLELETSTQNKNGKTYTNVSIVGFAGPPAAAAPAAGGAVVADATSQRLTAFDIAVKVGASLDETPDFEGLTNIAEAIFAWASSDDEDFEPDPEPPSAASDVPN